jgi:hypothetical protein
VRKIAAAQAFLEGMDSPWAPDFAEFPVKFPVSREFVWRLVRIPLRRQPGSPALREAVLGNRGNARQWRDQRAIDREVIARQELRHLRLRQHRRQELRRDVAFQQPVAVLGEHRMVPGCVVNADSDEPAEQQIVLQPLHQKPLGADRRGRCDQIAPTKLRLSKFPATRTRASRHETFMEQNERYKIISPRFIALLAACAEVTQSSL